jgi:hypothetical protein
MSWKPAPVADGVKPLAPPILEAVNVSSVSSAFPDSGSETTTPSRAEEPVLLTTMV